MTQRDANDGKEWSEMDVEDLIASAGAAYDGIDTDTEAARGEPKAAR